MKTLKLQSSVIILIIGLYCVLASNTYNPKKEPKSIPGVPTAKSFLETQTMCAGSIPKGWLKSNDYWSPATCGNPTSISFNVYEIVRYDNLPSGALLNACNISTPPDGWIKVSTAWSPSTCGHPTSISQNTMAIKKL
jgi:hypothetical protein